MCRYETAWLFHSDNIRKYAGRSWQVLLIKPGSMVTLLVQVELYDLQLYLVPFMYSSAKLCSSFYGSIYG